MLKKISFAAAILGIVFLLSYLDFSYKEISGAEELKDLEINSKVIVEGKIENYRDYGKTKIFYVKGIEIFCRCDKLELDNFEDKNVEIKGVVGEYEDKKQIEVLGLKIIR